MIKVPCYKCDLRKLHCHSTCEQYKEYVKAIKLQKEQEKKEKFADIYRIETHRRLKKIMSKKWKGGEM